MFDVEALTRLLDEIWVAEWLRRRKVRLWSLYADCRERERHGHYGWLRPLVVWTGALTETRSEREQRRAWYRRVSAAQRRRADHKWSAVADGGTTRKFLTDAVKDLVMERQTYVEVEGALQACGLPPELVRAVWEKMEMDDAWGQLDSAARVFLWRIAEEVDAERAERVKAPWRLSWQRASARARWTRLVFGLRERALQNQSCGGLWQGQTLGWWDVLSPWRAGWQPWRVRANKCGA